jgi:hypothetical protein
VENSLFIVCTAAFAAVFVLLSFMAVAMRLLIMAYPAELRASHDAALVAAITTTMDVTHPGTTVTKIKEVR